MYSINTEVLAIGDSLSWDTNQRVCDITTVTVQREPGTRTRYNPVRWILFLGTRLSWKWLKPDRAWTWQLWVLRQAYPSSASQPCHAHETLWRKFWRTFRENNGTALCHEWIVTTSHTKFILFYLSSFNWPHQWSTHAVCLPLEKVDLILSLESETFVRFIVSCCVSQPQTTNGQQRALVTEKSWTLHFWNEESEISRDATSTNLVNSEQCCSNKQANDGKCSNMLSLGVARPKVCKITAVLGIFIDGGWRSFCSRNIWDRRTETPCQLSEVVKYCWQSPEHVHFQRFLSEGI